MMSTTVTTILHIILFLHIKRQAHSYSFFRDRIPNGHNVPNPCEKNSVWWGVGHENPNGGGDRNPFGVHFQELGMLWGRCICELDSDGDGRTNGEELGDPNCEFAEGATPRNTSGITHPGVCEPLDDHKCMDRNSFLNCQNKSFSCPAFADASVMSVNLTILPTPVPAEVTTYICQFFDLPTDGDYSLIGFTPLIDNINVVHHIVLYGCDDSEVPSVRPNYSSPHANCTIMHPCTNIIAVWSFGLAGECLGDEYGYRIGRQGIKAALMEIHWNNPMSLGGYTDSSGLTLYYTPNKRPNDAASILIGPAFLSIPPQQNGLEQYGLCPAECTNSMLQNTTVFVTAIFPHMHYLGRAMTVSIKKNGSDISKVVLDLQNYYYETPKVFQFVPPIELSPGDEVNVSCTYFSVNRYNYTFFGTETSDEMCFAVTTYYPYLPSATSGCSVSGSIIYSCGDITNMAELFTKCFQQSRFWNDTATFIGAQVHQNCDVTTGITCTPACKILVDNLTATYPECLNAGVKTTLLSAAYKRRWMVPIDIDDNQKAVILGLLSCDPKPGLGDLNRGESGGETSCHTSSASVVSTYSPYFYGLVMSTVANMLIN